VARTAVSPPRTAAWPGRTARPSTAAAAAVSTIDTSSHVSVSTPRLLAVASPKTGTTTPNAAYTRQIRCSVRNAAASPRRATAGNMLAATVTGPTATIAARTCSESRIFVTSADARPLPSGRTVAEMPRSNGFSPRPPVSR
jgi:hypothetical protein